MPFQVHAESSIMESVEHTFKILAQGSDVLQRDACISGFNTIIFGASELGVAPSRREFVTSYFTSVITTLYTPMFAVAADPENAGVVTKTAFLRAAHILVENGITKDSTNDAACDALFKILDVENRGVLRTEQVVEFVSRMSPEMADGQHRDAVRQRIDPSNSGTIDPDAFRHVMNA